MLTNQNKIFQAFAIAGCIVALATGIVVHKVLQTTNTKTVTDTATFLNKEREIFARNNNSKNGSNFADTNVKRKEIRVLDSIPGSNLDRTNFDRSIDVKNLGDLNPKPSSKIAIQGVDRERIASRVQIIKVFRDSIEIAVDSQFYSVKIDSDIPRLEGVKLTKIDLDLREIHLSAADGIIYLYF